MSTANIQIETSHKIYGHGFYIYFTVTCENKQVLVTKFKNGNTSYVNVVVNNAAHKAYRGTGKDFKSLADAIASYKDETIKSMLQSIN